MCIGTEVSILAPYVLTIPTRDCKPFASRYQYEDFAFTLIVPNILPSASKAPMSIPQEVTVLGVLLDPMLSFGQVVEHGQTVHETVTSLWDTTINQVDKGSAPETTDFPLATQVFLGKFDLFDAFKVPTLNALPPASNLTDASQSTFPALASLSPTELYLVMFGMPQSWSDVGQVSKGNKENVVTSMAKLSLNDDVGSGKLASGLKKPNSE
jgi:hypothetical protein